MYDAGKILLGLIVFVALATSPIWLDRGKAAPAPKLELTPRAKLAGSCVESEEFMRSSHMKLLDEWRDAAVRNDTRVYMSDNGRIYDISLQNTCLDCHSNKEKFCDRCHEYAGVRKLYCFDCHLEPKERRQWAATGETF